MLFSYILILFALRLRRLHAILISPPFFQTWKKHVFLRDLLNYAYDFDEITPTDKKHCNHLKFEIKMGVTVLRRKIQGKNNSIFPPFLVSPPNVEMTSRISMRLHQQLNNPFNI